MSEEPESDLLEADEVLYPPFLISPHRSSNRPSSNQASTGSRSPTHRSGRPQYSPGSSPSTQNQPQGSFPSDHDTHRSTFVNETKAGFEFFLNLAELRHKKLLCDVEVVATGLVGATAESEREPPIQLHAHRVVLSASSPYFNAMFTGNMRESRMEVIQLKDMDGTALSALIDYMYTGILELDQTRVQGLLVTAAQLDLHCARDACARYLLEQMDASNCLGMASFAAQHGCSQLERSATTFCQQHFWELMAADEFLQLDVDQLLKLVSDDRLTTKGEHNVFEAVIKWVMYDKATRKEHMARLLFEVRLPFVSEEYLLTVVCEEPLVVRDARCKDLLLEAFKLDMRKRWEEREAELFPENPTTSVNNILVMVIGGQAPKAVRSVETFDLDNQKWMQLESLPQRRCRCGVASLDEKTYVIGGFNGSTRIRTVDIYNPERDDWQPGVAMEQRRSTLGVAVLEDQKLILAVGGFDGNTGLSSAEAFDNRIGRWQAIPSMNVRRSSVAVAALNGCVYAVGGYDGYAKQCLNTVRSGAAIAVLGNDTIVAIGGHDGPIVRNTVEALSPSADGWKTMPEMGTMRRNAGLVTVGGGSLLAVGGDNGHDNLKSCEMLFTEGRELVWKELSVSMPQARSYCGVTLLSKK